MTVQNPTLNDLVYEIDKEIEVLNETAATNREAAEQRAGTTDEYRCTARARAYEWEADRLTAVLAKYQAVTA